MSTDDEHRPDSADEFRDPTAPPPLPDLPDRDAADAQPVVDQTQPVPPPPLGAEQAPRYEQPTYTQPSYGLPSYDQQPPSPYGAPPAGSPYGTPPAPPAAPIPAAGPAAPPPGTPGEYPYAAPPVGYGPPPSNTSAIILTVVSGFALVACCGVLQLPALAMGIIALTRQSTDPAGSARMARRGWIAFGIGIGVMVLIAVGYVALGVSGVFGGGVTSPYGGS